MSASTKDPVLPISEENQNKQQPGDVTCSVCKGEAKASQHTLRCTHCANTVHLTCQCKLFKEAGNEGVKKIDWLAEFIQFTTLAYRCKACAENSATVPPSITNSVTKVDLEIIAVKNSIASLDNKIQCIHDFITKQSSSGAITSDSQPEQRHPPTYAQAVSADIVKSAVSEAMREQQKAITNKSSIVIYGFPEEGKDIAQLQEMLDFLNCQCDVTRSTRVGREYNGKVRPIKMELRTSSDASIILSRAKYLRHNAYYSGVYVSKWLSEDEMKAVKTLRQQCDSLNKNCKNGRKQFVVISGRLMQRDVRGRLQTFNSSQSNTIIASLPETTSQPKNAA